MKCLCNVRCRLVKDIDMFGKEPELYYKTRPKKTSWMEEFYLCFCSNLFRIFSL